VALTHLGALDRLPEAAAQLRDHLRVSAEILRDARNSAMTDEAIDAFCETQLRRHLESYANSRKLEWTALDQELLELDVKLNAQRIAHIA
jgi:hypothetical protein